MKLEQSGGNGRTFRIRAFLLVHNRYIAEVVITCYTKQEELEVT